MAPETKGQMGKMINIMTDVSGAISLKVVVEPKTSYSSTTTNETSKTVSER